MYHPTNSPRCFAQLHSSSAPLPCPYSHPAVKLLPAITDQALNRPPHAMPQADAPELFKLDVIPLVSSYFTPSPSPPGAAHTTSPPRCVGAAMLNN